MNRQSKQTNTPGRHGRLNPAWWLLPLLLLTSCASFPKNLAQTPAILIYNEGEKKFKGGYYPRFYVDIYNSEVQLIAEKESLPVINGLNVVKNLPPGKLGKLDFFYRHSGMDHYKRFISISCDEVLARGDVLLLGYKLRTHNLSTRLKIQSVGYTAWKLERPQLEAIMAELESEEDLEGFTLRYSHEESIE